MTLIDNRKALKTYFLLEKVSNLGCKMIKIKASKIRLGTVVDKKQTTMEVLIWLTFKIEQG